MSFRNRIRAVQAWLTSTGTAALMLQQGADVRYLCGFSGSNGLMLITSRSARLFTDGRYTTQAAEESAGSGVRITVAKQLLTKIAETAVQAGLSSISYDAAQVTVAQLHAMERSLPDTYNRAARRRFFLPIDASPVPAMRQKKDASELEIMEQAARLGCDLFDHIVPHIAAGVPEREIAAELEFHARRRGADGMSFDTIVASGQRSALPHGHASAAPMPRRGFVTLDFGVILRGYCSDMTRTVHIGTPTREARAAYDAVLASELAGVDAVRAGVASEVVDAAARGVLRRSGLARFFTHSTGHGVGLEIHEGPRLGRGVQQRLETGMVVTVEPGIYMPGKFGIRIEDMVAVEETRGRILTHSTKELLTL